MATRPWSSVLAPWLQRSTFLLTCPVCFGASDSPMAIGMNTAVIALLGITVGVLTAFAAFFLYLMRRAKGIEPTQYFQEGQTRC